MIQYEIKSKYTKRGEERDGVCELTRVPREPPRSQERHWLGQLRVSRRFDRNVAALVLKKCIRTHAHALKRRARAKRRNVCHAIEAHRGANQYPPLGLSL